MSRAVRVGGGLFFLVALVGATWLMTRSPAVDYQVHPTRLFEQVITHVGNFGVDSIAEAELFGRAAEGLIAELGDEYASLSPQGEHRATPSDPNGLGIQFTLRGGTATVLGVAPLSPAWHGGLEAGDRLLSVGGVPILSTSREVVAAALETSSDSTIALQVRRAGVGTVMDLTFWPATPRPFRVSELVTLGQGVHYLAIYQAGPGVAEVVGRALRLLPSDTRGLVLDLRGAAGGSIEEATGLTELFVQRGEPVLRVQGRDSLPRSFSSQHDPSLPSSTSVVALVGTATADAAELLAGALQDLDRALLIGEPTFGRGLSQEEFTLSNQWVIRMSTQRWETPMGRTIQVGDSVIDFADRPVFATASGRSVRGGGGIVPDSLRARPAASSGWTELWRVLAPSLPVVLRNMDSLSVAGAGLEPTWRPTRADLTQLLDRLSTDGVRPAPELVAGGADELGRWLGDRLVATRLGEVGWVRRMAVLDPDLRLAVALLLAAATPSALVLGK